MHHTATEIAQKTVKCELNIHYDDPEGPTLDIYYPPDGQGEGYTIVLFTLLLVYQASPSLTLHFFGG